MKSVKSDTASSWRQVIHLGDELLQASDLADQRQLIIRAVSKLLDCRADLWLDARLHRLPGITPTDIFPEEPPSGLMQQAATTSAVCFSAPGKTPAVAVPLRSQELTIGVLRLSRKSGEKFTRPDIELLEGVAGHISLALVASHRFAVEQWRIEQLTLVRRVSGQIANMLDTDKLTRLVTRLIQNTFHYYYVAIFDLEPGKQSLHFQASAGPAGGRGRRRSPSLRVNLGEGLIGTVAKSGEEITSNDIRNEPRFRFIEALPETQSEVVLPLKIEDRVLGVLDVQSDRLNAFHPNDLLVLRALADTIAIALNSARLYTDLQKRAEHLAVVSEVSEDITSVLDLDDLLSMVAKLIQERLGFPYIHLFSVHPNRRQIIYEAGHGEISKALKGFVLDLDHSEGMIPWVARNRQAILANDVSREARYRPSPFPPEDTLSELTIPIVFDNQVLGVLDLQSDRLNAFSDEDHFLLRALADNIAVAMHNADLYRTERWRRQVADSLREVAGLVSSDFGVEQVIDRVLSELERNLPCDVSAIWLLDGDRLSLAHIHGADLLEVESAAHHWPESYRFLMETLNAVEPVIRKPDDPIGPTGLACGFSADYSTISISLRAGDRPLGVLTLSHHSPNRYGHEAQAVTATFASYAAVAIENARLYDSAQEQAYASAALLQVAQAVANSNSLEETLSSVVRITPILVGVHACVIYLWEAGRFRPVTSYGFSDEIQAALCGGEFFEGDFHLLDEVHQSSQMVIGILAPEGFEEWLDPELTKSEQEADYALKTSDHLLVGLPLVVKNDFYGVVLVEETEEARRFRPKRIEIVNSIAQQIALSIQNEHLQQEMVARERLEREIELARQIQETFLPDHLPEIPNWDLAATWRTARQVGGDYYDVFELPGRKLGFFIADVSDKGIPAALFMALTRTLVRAVVYDTLSPADAMRRVNELILPDNKQAMFVTAVYAVLSTESSEMTYVNAGHNPPLWICARDKKIEKLPRCGPALGVIQSIVMEERTIQVGDGDLLLLYTDGLTEAFSPQDEIYGEERLIKVIRSLPLTGCSARSLLETIEKSVDDFTGSAAAADDMTLLSFRRTV